MGSVHDRLTNRWLGGGLALLGVLLVVPSLLSPTWEMSVSDREHGALLSREWEWSWGRVRTTGLEGVELRDQWNAFGLVVLVMLFVAGLGGVAVWAVHRLAWGDVVGLVAVGLLTGRVLTTVADRVGRSLGEVDRGAAGLSERTAMTAAGSLETAAALVLVLAVVAMALAAQREARAPRVGPAAETVGLRPAGEHLSGPVVDLVEEERG